MRALRLAVLLLVVAAAPRAHATATSVTLLGVSGVGGVHFAALLDQELSELYTTIAGAKYRAKALELNMPGAAPEQVQAVAAALNVDAVVAGAIAGQGVRRRLTIVVRSGSTGRVVARGQYDLGAQALPLLRDRVVADLVRAFERITPVAAGSSVADDGHPEEQPGDAASLETVTRAAPVATYTWRGISAGAGLAIMTRSLGFDARSAPAYSGGAVAGFRVDGAVYPLALSAELAEAHPVLASFGIAGSYTRSTAFASTAPNGAVATGRTARWYVLFVGAIPLGHSARGGMLTLETGMQELGWSSTSALDLGVPDVNYDLLDFGLGWEHGLGTRRVVVGVRAAVQGLLSAGDITSDAQYGRATGWGAEGELSLTAWPARWLWLKVAGRATALSLQFAASGARFARSAGDTFLDGALEVGFAL